MSASQVVHSHLLLCKKLHAARVQTLEPIVACCVAERSRVQPLLRDTPAHNSLGPGMIAGCTWQLEIHYNCIQYQRLCPPLLAGSAMGGMNSFATAVEALETQGHRRMNPFCIPNAITNMPGAMLAMEIGFMGPNFSISTACATGNYCILSAAQDIRTGRADIMLAGAADASIIPAGAPWSIAQRCWWHGRRCFAD